jgi:S-adenosylmethionine:tRNA ribosyltransferase-isomerase
LDFELPPHLEATEPPEARGLSRDGVRLLVSHREDDRIVHAGFRDLPDSLEPGDVLVVNTSGTMNAALPARRADGPPLTLHLSTHLPADLWTVELRTEDLEPLSDGEPGEVLGLPDGGVARLHVPFLPEDRGDAGKGSRLWIATLDLPLKVTEYLDLHGAPIRYRYVREPWPSEYYQTVYATEKGSAEMPSAGRAFTPELLARLVSRGVQVAPLILHTGVASLEEDEPPYEEFYRVPDATARLVNAAHRANRRVVAVGTTVVRALETVTGHDGVTHPGEGWTGEVITPERGVRAVDAMLTGLHEPRSTHLWMLEAVADRGHLGVAYREALEHEYLWHEFGDLHLIL